MDNTDRALLNEIQTGFPVDAHPYQVLGTAVGITEEEAFEHIENLRKEGLIRRLGGVFDSARLGYSSTLCAAKVPEEKIPLMTDLLAAIPGVTHNYLRNHDYNMWFTVIAPSAVAVEETLQKVRQAAGIEKIYSLPALRMFKIQVEFDFADKKDAGEEKDQGKPAEQPVTQPGARSAEPEAFYSLTKEDIALVRALQGSLPHSIKPFAEIAANLGWAEEDVISRARNLIEVKAMRRFGAVLRHQKAGFVANSMGVWQVPEEIAEETGKIMATFKEVSHCYQRPSLPDWPYTLFTMVHGRSVEECKDTMERISAATGITEYGMLFSTKELKKTSMQYFMEDEFQGK